MRFFKKYEGDARHKAMILATIMAAALVIGLGYEVYYSLTVPGRRPGWPAYLSVLVVFACLFLGYLRAASVLAVAAFPVGVSALMFLANPIVNPSAILQYLVIDLFLCAVLFGMRGIVLMTFVNVAVMLGLWFFIPDRVQRFDNLPLSPTIAAGLVLTLYAYYRSVTDASFRKRILDQEAEFKQALEGTRMGIWTWRMHDSRMVWSDSVHKVFGVHSGVFGATNRAFLKAVHPDDRENVQGIITRAASGENRDYWAQFRVIWPDASTHWIDIRGHAYPGADGRVEFMRGTVVDITEEKQRAEELEESRRLAQGIAEASPLIMYVYDIEKRKTTYANRRIVLELGYSLEEALDPGGSFTYSLLHPDDKPALADFFTRWENAANDQILETEYRLLDKSGRYRWFATREKVFRRSKDGKVAEIVGTIQDMTERKESLEQLRKSEEKYKLLVETASDGIFLVSADGIMEDMNERAAQMLGFDRSELIGRHVNALRDPEVIKAQPVGLSQIPPGQAQIVQRQFRTRNGEALFVEVNVRHMPDGRFLSIVRDVTERLRNQNALEESQRRWEFVMQNAPAYIILADQDGRILHLNRSVRGLPLESVISRSLYDFIKPEFRGRLETALQEAVPGRPSSLEMIGPGDDDQDAWYSTNVGVVDQTNGKKTLILICADITVQRERHEETQRLNEELERRVSERTSELQVVNRELESFSYSVSHDLRAPLRGIHGWSVALEEDYAATLDETAKSYIHRVRNEAKRMDSLIQDLLRLSRVSRAEMRREQIDLSALALERAEAISKQDPSRKMQWSVESGMTAFGDPGLIEILLDNLLENAWKFTGKAAQPMVSVGTSKEAGDRRSVFFVRDNGAGFDMAFAGRLFAPFQRQHTAAEFQGSGIGLATVQRIVNRHGGKIWAKAAPNEGATFFFTLGGDL